MINLFSFPCKRTVWEHHVATDFFVLLNINKEQTDSPFTFMKYIEYSISFASFVHLWMQILYLVSKSNLRVGLFTYIFVCKLFWGNRNVQYIIFCILIHPLHYSNEGSAQIVNYLIFHLIVKNREKVLSARRQTRSWLGPGLAWTISGWKVKPFSEFS